MQMTHDTIHLLSKRQKSPTEVGNLCPQTADNNNSSYYHPTITYISDAELQSVIFYK